MKLLEKITFLTLILFFSISCQESIPLFEANSDTWLQKGDAEWHFENGEITASLFKGTGFLMTKETYSDFELELQFNPDEAINSGVFVRCKDYDLSNTDCYEFNIWDEHPDQLKRTGAIVSRTTPLKHVETIGKWNTYRIRCEKNHMKAWINDVLVADIINDDLKEGYIGLQADLIGTIGFRNITLKVL